MRRGLDLWAVLALAATTPVMAEVTPHGGDGDPHIQSVTYDPDQVVALHVAGGYAVTVLFSPDERIETVTLGDSAGWQVAVDHRAEHLVVKPLGNPRPTNLTVISDQRTYNFSLYGADTGEGVQPYTVSFIYPPPPAMQVVPVAQTPGRYKLHGARSIWPATMSDDGEFTAITWKADTIIPAVYQQDDHDQLALVNGVMRGGAYMIEGVHRRLVFILGSAHASASRIAEKSRR